MTNPILAFPTEHGRFYQRPGAEGAPVPSITNIINMKSKPLFRAGLKKAASYAAENRERLAALTEDEVFKLVSNPPQKDDEPAAIGDLVHKWIEGFINGNPPAIEEVRASPHTARWMFERFVSDFHNPRQPQYTATEFTVWSNRYGYAGTADFSAMLYGHHTLVDTKTGKAAYPEVAMQLAAIANADFVLAPDGTESRVPEYTRYAVLHVRPRSAKLHPVYNIEAAFECFLALKHVFDWNINYAPRSIGYAPKPAA